MTTDYSAVSFPPGIDALFDHVAIAGPSIEAMLPLYVGVLNGTPTFGWTNEAFGFRTFNIDYPNGTHIELLEALPGSTFLDSFFARNGGAGGLHHVTFTVPDIAATIEILHERGYATFGERLVDPVWAEAFVHPRDAGGVLLQVAQKGV